MEVLWDIAPFFDVAGVSVRYYSLIFAAALVVGWLVIGWQIKRGGGEESDANWLLAIGMISVTVGGRLVHLFVYEPHLVVADPWIIFRVREGGLASHGSTLGLLVGIWLFARAKKISAIEVYDRMAMSVALGAASVRIGNLLNSEVVGRPTDQTWGWRFPYHDGRSGEIPLRHPSQLYEFVLAAAVFVVLWAIDRKLGERRPRGLLIAVFFALYFSTRFMVEFFKEYQALSPDFPLTMGQLLSIVPALVGLWGVREALKRRRGAGWGP